MALPHLHLHTQAVEEMSREGQAVHGRECGINPAWGRQMWLALHGVLTPGSRWLPGLSGRHGLSAPAHLIPMEGALAWPRILSGWALQEGDCPSWPSLLNPALNSTDGETQAWERRGRVQTTQGQATHHSRPLHAGAEGDNAGLPPLRGELGFSLHHPQRCSLGQTWGNIWLWGARCVCVVGGEPRSRKAQGQISQRKQEVSSENVSISRLRGDTKDLTIHF